MLVILHSPPVPIMMDQFGQVNSSANALRAIALILSGTFFRNNQIFFPVGKHWLIPREQASSRHMG